MDIQDYYIDFMQDIYAVSDSDSNFNESVFTERICDFLVDQQAIENYAYVGYKKLSKGIRVDAWNFNHETGALDLIITDFRFNNDLESLTQTDTRKLFKRLERFFTESLDIRFHQALEESTPGFELAREIYEKCTNISKIRFYLISNAELSSLSKTIENRLINGRQSSFEVWDIKRLFRIESSGKAREDVIIDFQEISPSGIQCLPAFTGAGSCESYLLVMPGEFLAKLYYRYGERLLEQNVRTFLQFRGNVNKGIRNTIQNEPEMFFAYNNGLTATAEHVVTDDHRHRIKSVTNLQIVNGGQTTASIATAMKKDKAVLSDIYIQVKLSVIPPKEVETVVPKISEFANTQNKVNAADFFSNHPFHLRIEELSRRLWAPSPDGGTQLTHWFYERARGQYATAQTNLKASKKTDFRKINPKGQMFTKTDLAKYEHSFSMMPHIVSLGAQKNFAKFADGIGRKWKVNESKINELYFQNLIAKKIIFRYLDKNIMKQDWYGGYKANIVTYSLAKLAKVVSDMNKRIDLLKIWKQQQLSPALETVLLNIAKSVNTQIQDTPDGITNVTEWCKKERCWAKVQELEISLGQNMVSELIDTEEINEREKGAQKNQKIDNGIHNQSYVVEKGAEYWKLFARWALEHNILNKKEMDILAIACMIPAKSPTERQANILMSIEKKGIKEGFSV